MMSAVDVKNPGQEPVVSVKTDLSEEKEAENIISVWSTYTSADSSVSYTSVPIVYNFACTVEFNVQDASATEPVSQTVAYGETIKDPSVDGVEGWYKDAACSEGEEWDFATDVVSGNMTLYAKRGGASA